MISGRLPYTEAAIFAFLINKNPKSFYISVSYIILYVSRLLPE